MIGAANIFVLVMLFGCAFGAVWAFVVWRIELKFYEKQNWNFEIESGRKLYYGTGRLNLGLMPNKERVVYGYWRIILICGFAFVIFAFALHSGIQVEWK
jgi:hypothetical protein